MIKRFPTAVAWKAMRMALIALLVLGGEGLRAADFVMLRGEDVVVVSEESLATAAGHVRDVYPKLKAELEAVLGWRLHSRPIVRLVGSKELFEKMSGGPHFSAFAVPSQAVIVLFVSPLTSSAFTWNETFKHELCHLLLHDHIAEALLPKWLDEGVCQWVSGSLGEIFSMGGFPDTGVALARHPIPLRQLAHAFPRDRDALFLAYEASRRFVEYLTATYGKESLFGILNLLSTGEDIDRAVARTLSKSLDVVEQEWLESLQGSGAWLIWVSRHLYDFLFFFAALLTMAAFIVLVMRRRRYADDEEDDDDSESPPDAH